MLVLSRTENQRIYIDGGVEILVMDIDKKQVRLGITAPKDTRIWRDDMKKPKPKTTTETKEGCD